MTSTNRTSIADLRDRLAVLSTELKTLHDNVYQCPTNELGAFLSELAELRALAGAAATIVTADADTRGVVEASQSASTRGWVAEHGWHSRREATTIAKAARILRRPELAELADSIRTADLDLTTAVVVQAEYDKLVPDLKPGSEAIVLNEMAHFGAEHGPRGVRQLRQYILAMNGNPDEFSNFQDRCRRHISLSPARETSTGVHEYRLVVDNEGLSIIEAAIQALSAPRPDAATGECDTRPNEWRRGEALIEALSRSALVNTQGVTAVVTAMVTITMNLDHLQQRVGAAICTGTIADGTLLAPDSARRLACDAGIIPTVLGADGAILDCGTQQRLFTLAQKRALWQRDRHCTFPRCDVPRSGPTPTTSCTGSTADTPTSTTPPCSAAVITPSSTATNYTVKWLRGRSSGIEDPERTDRHEDPQRSNHPLAAAPATPSYPDHVEHPDTSAHDRNLVMPGGDLVAFVPLLLDHRQCR